MRQLFATGRGVTTFAAGWAIFDAILHVLVDEVEPLRITGNVITVAAAALVRFVGEGRMKALICGLAAGAVLILNVIWAIDLGSLPPIALVLFSGAVIMLALAAKRFNDNDS